MQKSASPLSYYVFFFREKSLMRTLAPGKSFVMNLSINRLGNVCYYGHVTIAVNEINMNYRSFCWTCRSFGISRTISDKDITFKKSRCLCSTDICDATYIVFLCNVSVKRIKYCLRLCNDMEMN